MSSFAAIGSIPKSPNLKINKRINSTAKESKEDSNQIRETLLLEIQETELGFLQFNSRDLERIVLSSPSSSSLFFNIFPFFWVFTGEEIGIK